MKVPVIVEVDRPFSEPQGTLHYFCCVGCRSQSPHHDPHCQETELAPASVEAGTGCEICGRDVHRNANL
jgi:hypothetical protein